MAGRQGPTPDADRVPPAGAAPSEAAELLVQREGLATLGLLTAAAAHEINSPLCSALSVLEMMREAQPDQRDLAFAVRQLERIQGLVQSMLGLSRPTDDLREAVSLQRVCADAARLFSTRHKGVLLEQAVDDSLPEIRANFALLVQVAVNLLDNAARAAPAGSAKVRLSAGGGGRFAFLRVEDNGPGVPDELRERIWQPRFTTRPPGEGTGLGLHVARLIADQHGATFEVTRSSLLGGASFTLWLPAWGIEVRRT